MSDAGSSTQAPPPEPPGAPAAPASEPAQAGRGHASRHRSKSKSKSRHRAPSQGARAVTYVRSHLPEWPRITGPEAALALAIVLGPLAIGAVHVPTRLVLAVLLTGALAWAAFRMHRDEQRVRAGWIGLGLLVEPLEDLRILFILDVDQEGNFLIIAQGVHRLIEANHRIGRNGNVRPVSAQEMRRQPIAQAGMIEILRRAEQAAARRLGLADAGGEIGVVALHVVSFPTPVMVRG